MEKEEAKKKKAPLSDYLYGLIYNPELNKDWDSFPYEQRMTIFHGLFRLLNPEFQKKFGTYLEVIVSLKAGRPCSISLSRKDYKAVSEYRSPLFLGDLCLILLRKYWPFSSIVKDYVDKKTDHVYRAVWLSIRDEGDDREYDDREYKEFIQSMKKGIVPSIVYPAVDLRLGKGKAMRDFKRLHDELHGKYFEQHSEQKHIIYGHKKLKVDGRRQQYDPEVMKKRFQAHVYDALGKKDKEIAEILYPGEKGNIQRIEKHILEAKHLTINAFAEDAEGFPGIF